jgi:hypothetical protein
LIQIERYVRQAIRDAVNQRSRKPFTWGGLKGYEQLRAIAQGLEQIQATYTEGDYLRLLKSRLEWVLVKNRTVAEDLKNAHQILQQVAGCLNYPPRAQDEGHTPVTEPMESQRVAEAMDKLIQEAHAVGRVQRAQIRLLSGLQKRWKLYGQELLYCYTIPGLPADNLKLESWFGRLRRHQRRISGRKSTQELLDFGHAQVLFTATSFQQLLGQIQLIPPEVYYLHRERLAAAERPRQFSRRLHHDPLQTIQALVFSHQSRSQSLTVSKTPALFEQALHTT